MGRAVFAFLFLFAVSFTSTAHAERIEHLAALKDTRYAEINSKEVDRSFHIHVRLPDDYDETKGPYPTVYLLDGDITFPMIAAYHYLLQFDEPDIPEAIIVGIAYGTYDPKEGNYRATDYSTPPLPKEYRGGVDKGRNQGGAAAFQRFLKFELIPHIEKNYRAASNRRILMGQSRGGHFVLFNAYDDPELFWGRIASNPPLTPNREFFFAGENLPSRTSTSLFFASAENDWPKLRKDALDWFALWPDGVEPPWRLEARTMPDSTHAAGFVNVYRDAMRWLFSAPE